MNNQKGNDKNHIYSELMIAWSQKKELRSIISSWKKSHLKWWKWVNTLWAISTCSKYYLKDLRTFLKQFEAVQMKMYVTIMVNKDKQHRDEFIAKISNDKEY